MNDVIQISVELDEQSELASNQNPTSGTMVLVVQESITIESIKGQLVEKFRGKISVAKKKLHQFTLSASTQVLQKGEEYRFPFQLINTNHLESYEGKNFSRIYEFEFKIELEETSYDRLKKSVWRKIASFFTGAKDFKDTVPVTFYPIKIGYKIVEMNEKFDLKSNYWVIFGIAMVSAALAFLIWGSIDSVFIGLAVGGLVGAFLKKELIKSLLGNFQLETVDKDENAFLAVVHSDKNWQMTSHPKLSYEVIEKTIDDRGTSSQTYIEKLFTSPTFELQTINQEKQATFLYPERHFPMISEQNASIRWKMKLELQTSLGFKATYDKEFRLKR